MPLRSVTPARLRASCRPQQATLSGTDFNRLRQLLARNRRLSASWRGRAFYACTGFLTHLSYRTQPPQRNIPRVGGRLRLAVQFHRLRLALLPVTVSAVLLASGRSPMLTSHGLASMLVVWPGPDPLWAPCPAGKTPGAPAAPARATDRKSRRLARLASAGAGPSPRSPSGAPLRGRGLIPPRRE